LIKNIHHIRFKIYLFHNQHRTRYLSIVFPMQSYRLYFLLLANEQNSTWQIFVCFGRHQIQVSEEYLYLTYEKIYRYKSDCFSKLKLIIYQSISKYLHIGHIGSRETRRRNIIRKINSLRQLHYCHVVLDVVEIIVRMNLRCFDLRILTYIKKSVSLCKNCKLTWNIWTPSVASFTDKSLLTAPKTTLKSSRGRTLWVLKESVTQCCVENNFSSFNQN